VTEVVGLAALVTGGTSGGALATAILLAARGARMACLDLAPERLPEPRDGSRAGITDNTSVRAAAAAAATQRRTVVPARTR
jgi:NAD(P)-dependent dehydrogenase (short-subunit alcohol dehydrogenase family)